ncbi:MAG: hypothetical protein ACQEUT_07270 [Bacillota bacterium]
MKYIREIMMVFAGLVLISCLPALFYGGLGLSYVFQVLIPSGESIGFYPLRYLLALKEQLILLFNPYSWEVAANFGKTYPLVEVLWNRYSYSMRIFLMSLTAAVIITFLITILHTLLSLKLRKMLNFFIDILESLPDVFIIVGLQLGVILIFKETGTLVAEIAMLNEEIYFLPVICLTIVPAVFLLKTSILLLNEEEGKQYVDLAKGKGMSPIYILLIHSFRNVMFSLFYRSKIIFAFMLSNLFIIERLFNMKGIMDLLVGSHGYTFVLIVLTIFLPFYIVFSFVEYVLLRKTGQREEEIYV